MERGRSAVDYAVLFAALPVPCLVLDRALRIVAVNDAYLEITGHRAGQLVGRDFFAAFPPDPREPASHGAEAQRHSLESVLRSGSPNWLMLHRFAVPGREDPGGREPRWWNVVNQPVLDSGGRVEFIIHRVEDVTEFARTRSTETAPPPEAAVSYAELFARSQELQRANDRLRQSTEAVHDTAMALQKTMLATPDLAAHPEIAVRYRPAERGLNACGDWYDVVDLGSGRLALTVGDVVGHGVAAASVMGMLRSALSAAVRVADGPSGALETLGLYARAHEGALATTTFACQLFSASHLLTYSNAGHPPPLLMRADGTHAFLDQATDPPLGVRPEHVPRPQASVDYARGDTLVLYTDGMVERRGEDIDVGLARLTEAVRALRRSPVERIADTLLDRLADPGGQQDDISLLVIRL